MSKNSSYNLAYFVSHPIQYQAPLLRILNEHPDINLEVFFLNDNSTKQFYDSGFGVQVKWDVPLLEGYNHNFLVRPNSTNSLGELLSTVWSVKKALNKKRWDAVWFHGYSHPGLFAGIFISFARKIPVLFRAESNLISTSKGYLKDIFIRTLIKRSCGLLWISSLNKSYYEYYGANSDQLFFMPYAVNNEFFQKLSKHDVGALRTKLGITENLPVILFASKMIPRKNASLLMKAYVKLTEKNRRPPAYLLFVGDGEQRQEIEELMVKNQLFNYVKILGFKNQTELPAYFSVSDLFVLPSNKEPFGLIINEVMNAGKAIITTDEVGAAHDLVEEGVNGFITRAGDLQSLSHALEIALSDKVNLKAMGLASLEKINSWSYEQDVEGLLTCLSSIREKTNENFVCR